MNRRGMTLMELLVVTALIGIVMGLILPAVQATRASAARTDCGNRLKQLGLALHNYESCQGHWPSQDRRDFSHRPEGTLGWMALLLPHIGHESAYANAVSASLIDRDPTNNPPHTGLTLGLSDFVCPADGRTGPQTDAWGRTLGFTSYLGVAGTFDWTKMRWIRGTFGERRGPRTLDFTDGTSLTVAVGERPPPETLQAGWWYPIFVGDALGKIYPNHHRLFGRSPLSGAKWGCPGPIPQGFSPGQLSKPCDRFHFWSLHPGGGNWLFVDGSVRYMAYSAEPVLMQLATRSGGEIVTLPE